MKKSIYRDLTVVILIAMIISSCTKVDRDYRPNKVPNANAGNDIAITLPIDSVILNASASNDPDGSIISYGWSKISGPTSFNLANLAAAQTQVTMLIQGVYQFELKVTDDKGSTAKDTVNVTVNPVVQVNHSPVANAGINQMVNFPASSTYLDGRSSSDPDNNLATYAWVKLAGPAAYNIHEPSTAITLITGLVFGGIYEFELTVTDSIGLFAKDTVTILCNRPPFANAGTYQAIHLPANTVTLNASNSSDPDNNIASYKWTKIFGPSSFSFTNAAASQTQVTNLVEGEYMFQVEVKDEGNLISSNDVWIRVDTLIPNNIITFNNLSWQTDCRLIVNNISSSIPQGQSFKIYVRWISSTGTVSNWQYAKPKNLASNYEMFNYEVVNGNLQVNGAGIDCGFDDAQSYSIGIVLL